MFFDAFHRSIPAMAAAGLDLLIEHIVEEQRWADDLTALLAGLDVFWVGVHAPVEVMTAREIERGNRTVGEAAYHLKTHTFCRYGCEVDTTHPVDEITSRIVTAWIDEAASMIETGIVSIPAPVGSDGLPALFRALPEDGRRFWEVFHRQHPQPEHPPVLLQSR